MVGLHVGAKVGCRSVGIEVSENRFGLSLELLDRLIKKGTVPDSWKDRYYFFNKNCATITNLSLVNN